jgi:hypothetical protein
MTTVRSLALALLVLWGALTTTTTTLALDGAGMVFADDTNDTNDEMETI